MSWLEQLHQPVVFAHRGASAWAPENTLAAFRMAVEHRAPAIELDVKLTADRQVVVLHDQTVDRTTDGHGDLRKFTLADLRKLDASNSFATQYMGERIPTLAEVFEAVGEQVYINVELTNYASTGDNLTDLVASLVRQYGMQDRVIFSSFFPFNLLRIQRRLPHAPGGLLASEGPAGRLARGLFGRWITPAIIHPYYQDVDDHFMRRQKQFHRRVHVWTIDEPKELLRLASLGVDGIFTNDPRLALQTISTYPKNRKASLF
jgi:glycerophosphoryl diester phosphodiesterase